MRPEVIPELGFHQEPWDHVNYLQQVLKESRKLFILWTPWMHHQNLSQIPRIGCPDCSEPILILGRRKMNSESWVQYFASKAGCPWIWRREFLLNALDALMYIVPDVRYVPYQLALQASLQDRCLLRVSGDPLTRAPWAHNLPTGQELRLLLQDAAQQPLERFVKVRAVPLVTVVLCAYNEDVRIGWAIASVLRQTMEDWELLVVDDGSTDFTNLAARRFTDGRIRIISVAQNKGKAHALNCALAQSQGTYMLELDADDWLSKDALEQLCKRANLSKPMCLVTSHYHVWSLTSKGELRYRGIRGHQPIEITENGACVPIPRCYRTQDLRKRGGWFMGDSSQGRWFEDVAMTSYYLSHGSIDTIEAPLYHRVIRKRSISQQHDADYREWWDRFLSMSDREG